MNGRCSCVALKLFVAAGIALSVACTLKLVRLKRPVDSCVLIGVVCIPLGMLCCAVVHGGRVSGCCRRRDLLLRGLQGRRLSARLGLLGSRCRPRFLFGTLGAVCFRVRSSGVRTGRSVRLLSRLLHCRLCSVGRGMAMGRRLSCLRTCVRFRQLQVDRQLMLARRCSRRLRARRVRPLLFRPLMRGTFGCIDKTC